MNAGNGPLDPQREPSAQVREAAKQMREMFVALVREGFTEPQALTILGAALFGAKGP